MPARRTVFAGCVLPVLAASLLLTCSAQGPEPAQAPAAKSVSELLNQGLQAYRTGKFDAAVENYQAALQQDPKSGEAYAGLARIYLKQEKVQLAFEAANK